jgi:hypothetical protein
MDGKKDNIWKRERDCVQKKKNNKIFRRKIFYLFYFFFQSLWLVSNYQKLQTIPFKSISLGFFLSKWQGLLGLDAELKGRSRVFLLLHLQIGVR